MTKELLLHWWQYYGKFIYTYEELEKFSALIDKHGVEKITEAVLASFVSDDGSPTCMLLSIRQRKEEQLIATLPDPSTLTSKQKEAHDALKSFLEKEFEASYYNINTRVTINAIIAAIMWNATIPKKRHRKRISFKNVVKVRFKSRTYYFDSRVLQKYEQDIAYIFNNVKTGKGSWRRLASLKNDFIWTEELHMIYKLMFIGLATGHIKYCKNCFKKLRNPYIICN